MKRLLFFVRKLYYAGIISWHPVIQYIGVAHDLMTKGGSARVPYGIFCKGRHVFPLPAKIQKFSNPGMYDAIGYQNQLISDLHLQSGFIYNFTMYLSSVLWHFTQYALIQVKIGRVVKLKNVHCTVLCRFHNGES